MPTNNAIDSQDPIQVSKGGTGQSTLTTPNGILAAGVSAQGAIQNIGTGSAGQVLTSNGTSLPSFVTPSSVGGTMVLLGTINFNNTADNYNLTSYFSSTYKTYKLIFTEVEATGVPNSDIRLRVSTNGGTSFIASGYTCYVQVAAANATFGFPITDSIYLVPLNGNVGQINCAETLISGYGTNKGIVVKDSTAASIAGNAPIYLSTGFIGGITVNGIQIYNGLSGTNYPSGQVSIYGIVQ